MSHINRGIDHEVDGSIHWLILGQPDKHLGQVTLSSANNISSSAIRKPAGVTNDITQMSHVFRLLVAHSWGDPVGDQRKVTYLLYTWSNMKTKYLSTGQHQATDRPISCDTNLKFIYSAKWWTCLFRHQFTLTSSNYLPFDHEYTICQPSDGIAPK